ncbi:organic solute transporter subunit beta-like [Pristis pectinata]|uniref:organic solute transporter subunit beta-like n=1 Tax=Pristis pectinata TaxID=685728 RepID=UPI00223E1C3C|nr:organic solute transporter subunit beta-like [Pristis pectinata]
MQSFPLTALVWGDTLASVAHCNLQLMFTNRPATTTKGSHLRWTLDMPATGRQKMSGLVKDLLGWFTLCLLLQDNPQVTSATLNKTRNRIGVENHNKTQKEKTTLAQQSHAIEDPTNWNYSILALAFVTLFLAFLILALSSRANKRRKIKALNEAKEKNETETDLTQKAMIQYVVEVDNITETDLMLQSKQDYNSLYPVPQTSSPKVSPKPGQILVEWKDGNISSLFTDGKEDNV